MKNKGFPSIKLDVETLENLGFENFGKDKYDIHDRWRIKIPYYNYQIQVTLGKYPKSNPNCGIVSLFTPEEFTTGIPPDLYEKECWTAEDHQRANDYRIKLEERTIPIAWFVDTPERLRHIIVALTSQNI